MTTIQQPAASTTRRASTPAWTLTEAHATAVFNAAIGSTPCTCGVRGAEATGHRAECTYRLVLESAQILSIMLQPRATLYAGHSSLAEMVSTHIASFRNLIRSADVQARPDRSFAVDDHVDAGSRDCDDACENAVDAGYIEHELAALDDIEAACRAELNTAAAIGIAEGAAAISKPLAHVPIHPRTGPLWANTVEFLDKGDRPKHYPTLALYGDARSARTHATRRWRDQLATAAHSPSTDDLAVSLQHVIDEMTNSINAAVAFAGAARIGHIDREFVIALAGEHDVPLIGNGEPPALDERIVALALDVAKRATVRTAGAPDDTAGTDVDVRAAVDFYAANPRAALYDFRQRVGSRVQGKATDDVGPGGTSSLPRGNA
ncbi:hypothetical protein [Paraburkholderia sp. SIMBA_054]|uniref:hypothetical protein n=1 Tax=Paraburkholderia sp. SIMBA_054 TaxID=3085795 RepID=UPI0039782415